MLTSDGVLANGECCVGRERLGASRGGAAVQRSSVSCFPPAIQQYYLMFSEENFEYECVYDDYLMPKLLKKVITYLNMGK